MRIINRKTLVGEGAASVLDFAPHYSLKKRKITSKSGVVDVHSLIDICNNESRFGAHVPNNL